MFDKRLAFTALAALTPLAIAVCGGGEDPAGIEDPNDPNVVAGEGVVTAAVHDSAAVLPAGRTAPHPADSLAYDGRVRGSAHVEIYSSAEGWVALGTPVPVDFEIFCEETQTLHTEASVPVGTYTSVRIVLAGITANIPAGATINTVPYAEPIVIAFGGQDATVTIEKSVTPFTVAAEGVTTIVFDLNTDAWITPEIVTAGTVDAATVQAAALVYVR